MRQFRSQLPPRELEFCVFRISRNEFDSGSLGFLPTEIRKEHGLVVRATQVLAQMKFLIDDLAFPLFPGLGHSAPLPRPLLASVLFHASDDMKKKRIDLHGLVAQDAVWNRWAALGRGAGVARCPFRQDLSLNA